tara:strand:- start:6185 stop:6463 length:279 start_codon:yes stop_codon:yes gene_type:complete
MQNLSVKQQVLATFKGQIVKASFVKADGSTRYFWGVLKSEKRDPKNIVTAYDFRKKAYRRFDLSRNFAIANRGKVASTILDPVTQEVNNAKV